MAMDIVGSEVRGQLGAPPGSSLKINGHKCWRFLWRLHIGILSPCFEAHNLGMLVIDSSIGIGIGD